MELGGSFDGLRIRFAQRFEIFLERGEIEYADYQALVSDYGVRLLD